MVEDMANALIRFENGASLLADVSFTLHAKKDEIAVKWKFCVLLKARIGLQNIKKLWENIG
jgi:hypothetical protein